MRLLLAGLLLTTVVSYGCVGREATAGGQSVGSEVPLAVHRGSVTARTVLSGELVAGEAEQLVAPNVNVWPVKIRWLAEDGVEVREGEPVVEFDNSQLVANLEQMRSQALAAFNQLSSLLAQAASEEANAAHELEQKRAAVAKAKLEAGVPEEIFAAREFQKRQLDLQKAELDLKNASAKLEATRIAKQAEVEIQRVSLEKARSEFSRAEAKLDLLVLRAARDGIFIRARNDREGRQVQLGDGVFPGTAVARLPDLATMTVSAQLFDVDDGRVAVGMPVVATLDAFPDLEFQGRVRDIGQIADQPNPRSLRRFFRTHIELERVDVERMRPGMSVKVVIDDEHEDALLVPRGSLDWTDDGPRVLRADGTWAEVDLGPCAREVCVLLEGLEESTPLRQVAADRTPS